MYALQQCEDRFKSLFKVEQTSKHILSINTLGHFRPILLSGKMDFHSFSKLKVFLTDNICVTILCQHKS